MAFDFASALRQPAGEAKKPEALPAGVYPGVVKSFEYDDKNQKNTPYVRFQLGLLGAPEGVELESGTDLSKRSLRRDFFLTPDAMWRLDDFLKSIGVHLEGVSYEEAIPNAVGAQVMVEVQQYLNQKNSEIGNQVGKVYGQG